MTYKIDLGPYEVLCVYWEVKAKMLLRTEFYKLYENKLQFQDMGKLRYVLTRAGNQK